MGPKSSKQNSPTVEPLRRDEIEELCRDTGFTEHELLDWHANFYNDCPDGKLTLKQFEQEYAKIMGKPTAKTADYIKHMFSVYDQDRNQFIDFREFVMALSTASAVNRLRLIETLFHVFDLDNDGKITKEEIGKMLHTLVDVTDSNNKHNSNLHGKSKNTNLQQRIDDAFDELNANADDHVTKDEFIEWYMKSGLISDVQSDDMNAAESSRFPKFGKKSRKQIRPPTFRKRAVEQEENPESNVHPVRHMSKMIERRTSTLPNNENFNDNNVRTTSERHSTNYFDNQNELRMSEENSDPVTSSADHGLSSSRENERWQHLFNSVLGQIRAERLQEQQRHAKDTDVLQSWNHESVQRTTEDYMRQNSYGAQNPSYVSTMDMEMQPSRKTTNKRPPSPDIITVRL